MDELLKSYLAGCLDCDGWFTIKRSTYNIRVMHDSGQATYSERVGLKQVTPEVPHLLHDNFGGYLRIEKPSTKNGKHLWAWSVSDRQAFFCTSTLLPYLRVKIRQAELLVELRRLKELPRIKSGTYIMTNRWGTDVTMPRRKVDPTVIQSKNDLFNKIKTINDVRTNQPVLI